MEIFQKLSSSKKLGIQSLSYYYSNNGYHLSFFRFSNCLQYVFNTKTTENDYGHYRICWKEYKYGNYFS